MPFTAIHDGDIVYPDDVSSDADVVCPECGDGMHIRAGHKTSGGVLKPRCFVHNPDASLGGMCPGGESDEHKLMKYVVSRRFQRMFEHGDVGREVAIPGTDRVGDVVVTFANAVEKLGKGVIAEIQYRHDDKDIQSVTREYLRAGFSVYWLNEAHFGADLETVEFPDIVKAWPNAVPTQAEWSGVEEPTTQLPDFGSRPRIEVRMPPEYFDKHESDLKSRWRLGTGEYDFDLVRPLSATNASRLCAVCGDAADVYLFETGVMSSFRCVEHTPESVETAELGSG